MKFAVKLFGWPKCVIVGIYWIITSIKTQDKLSESYCNFTWNLTPIQFFIVTFLGTCMNLTLFQFSIVTFLGTYINLTLAVSVFVRNFSWNLHESDPDSVCCKEPRLTLLVMVKVQALVHFLVVMFTFNSELTWTLAYSTFCIICKIRQKLPCTWWICIHYLLLDNVYACMYTKSVLS